MKRGGGHRRPNEIVDRVLTERFLLMLLCEACQRVVKIKPKASPETCAHLEVQKTAVLKKVSVTMCAHVYACMQRPELTLDVFLRYSLSCLRHTISLNLELTNSA